MNRLPLIALALTFVAGCGYSEDKFADDYFEATCDSISSCETDIVDFYVGLGLDDATAQTSYDALYAVCEADVTTDTGMSDTDDNCDFDSAAAQDCIDELNAADCGIWTGESTFPAVCATVCG